jgi:hypothetical protein
MQFLNFLKLRWLEVFSLTPRLAVALLLKLLKVKFRG